MEIFYGFRGNAIKVKLTAHACIYPHTMVILNEFDVLNKPLIYTQFDKLINPSGANLTNAIVVEAI